jgi:hypothetical protein
MISASRAALIASIHPHNSSILHALCGEYMPYSPHARGLKELKSGMQVL